MRYFFGSIKRKLLIEVVYPVRYKPGFVESYIPISLRIGNYPVIESEVDFSSVLKSIGNECYIGKRTIIENCSSIGNFCSISKDVKIGMRNHPLDLASTSPRFYLKKYGRVAKDLYEHDDVAPTLIEDDVLISSNVLVLEGVTIGKGAVIAAGAVVIENVKPYSIVGGVPAKHIKFRLAEITREKLMALDFSLEEDLTMAFDNN